MYQRNMYRDIVIDVSRLQKHLNDATMFDLQIAAETQQPGRGWAEPPHPIHRRHALRAHTARS